MIYIVEINSFKPYEYHIPGDDDVLKGSIKVKLPPVDIRLLDLSLDGIIPGRPGVYAPFSGYSYDIEGVEIEREKFVEFMDKSEKLFRETYDLIVERLREAGL